VQILVAMNAIDLLEEQHDEIDRLFSAIDKATSAAKKAALFDELATNLVAHDAIERELFYPACEAKMGLTDQLGEALAEHGVVEFCLFKAARAVGSDHFDHLMTVLREVVEHHVEEEEEEFFPKVKDALTADRLEELGEQMETRFEEARDEDFREPLRESLSQVLAGGLKTRPNGGDKSRTTVTGNR